MITLRLIDETNFLQAAELQVSSEQRGFVQSAPLILARAYAYRNQKPVCWGIYSDEELVGLALVHDLEEEPACYHLCEFLIDYRFQGQGFGQAALKLVLEHCRREGKFPWAEVCVRKDNAAAIHVYEKEGFRDSGYIDPATPDCLCMVCELYEQIRYRDIVLRDKRESDIDDWIRWYNVETQWGDWDAPDEPIEPVEPEIYRKERLEWLTHKPEGFRTFFEMDTAEGVHIGMVTSYAIDENYQWMSWKDARESGKYTHTIGLDICESSFWGRGLGTQALAAFVRYHLENGIRDICLQTWSGNIRMIRSAKRVGFVECNRFIGNRQIRGGTYDSLTFRLDEARFAAYLAENP